MKIELKLEVEMIRKRQLKDKIEQSKEHCETRKKPKNKKAEKN